MSTECWNFVHGLSMHDLQKGSYLSADSIGTTDAAKYRNWPVNKMLVLYSSGLTKCWRRISYAIIKHAYFGQTPPISWWLLCRCMGVNSLGLHANSGGSVPRPSPPRQERQHSTVNSHRTLRSQDTSAQNILAPVWKWLEPLRLCCRTLRTLHRSVRRLFFVTDCF